MNVLYGVLRGKSRLGELLPSSSVFFSKRAYGRFAYCMHAWFEGVLPLIICVKCTALAHLTRRLLLVPLLCGARLCHPLTSFRLQVAVHRHGCCVLQRCLDAAGPNLRIKLIDEVSEIVC